MSDERSVFVIKLPSPMVTAWARLDAPVTVLNVDNEEVSIIQSASSG